MKVDGSNARKRLTALLSVLPIVAALVLIAYKFGPSPNGAAVDRKTNEPETARAPPKSPDSQPSNTNVLKLLGIIQTPIDKGRVQMSQVEYLNSLETRYLERGYQKLNDNSLINGKQKRRDLGGANQLDKVRFYLRQESDGVGSIYAVGSDADLTASHPAGKPVSVSTMVVPFGDGQSEWASYRLEIDLDKAKSFGDLDHGDFPGADPRDIPRLSGLQRIYALTSSNGSMAIYKSNEAESSVMAHYLNEMPRYGWGLDPDHASNTQNSAPGVMYFTRGVRFCMIWITTNKETGTTNVTISSQ
jgi:hypothetical protein